FLRAAFPARPSFHEQHFVDLTFLLIHPNQPLSRHLRSARFVLSTSYFLLFTFCLMPIRILVTGGTFDKEYNERTGQLYFKDTHLAEMLRLGRSRVEV